MLEDDVWRLKKIGKDGAFHKKMAAHGIKTVQDFLKLAVIDTHKLRKVFIYLSISTNAKKKKKKNSISTIIIFFK